MGRPALDYGLIMEKVYSVIQFSEKAWLKPYIDVGTKLRTKAKHDFKKDFFKLINNSVFGKTTENVRNHRNVELVTTNKRRNKLASEPNYHTKNTFQKSQKQAK